MKIKFLKYGVPAIVAMAVNFAHAQTKPAAKKKHTYTNVNKDDQGIQTINSREEGRDYTFKLVNNTVRNLTVDGVRIAVADYTKYAEITNRIRKQVIKDLIQAKKDQEQAARDQVQAKRDQEQANKDQADARNDPAQANRDQEQAQKDQVQAKRDQEQAQKDLVQAKLDQEQAEKDQVQAKRDQEQAKIDQKEAAEDQRQMKLMISDLISDGIISNEAGLHTLTLSARGMTVNDKQQPETVFNRYKTKYSRFAGGDFTFNNGPGRHSMNISRHSYNNNK
jgi:hypothetical protein